MKQLY
ncbi:uncharacterized protein FFB14_15315 [Fusarium fujikuroi]